MDIKGIARWNFDADIVGLWVCRGDHERSHKCTMERLSPYETLEIMNAMRSQLLHVDAAIKTLTPNAELTGRVTGPD